MMLKTLFFLHFTAENAEIAEKFQMDFSAVSAYSAVK
jgi:hypothetical protein